MVTASLGPMVAGVRSVNKMSATEMKIVMLLSAWITTNGISASDVADNIEDIWKKYRELPLQEIDNEYSIDINGTEKNSSSSNGRINETTTIEDELGINEVISKVYVF